MTAAGLRKVDVVKFKSEPELSVDGKLKVYEIEHYSGKFKDSKGREYDLRPMESCPSMANFSKFEKPRLQELLMHAYESQLQDLFDLNKKSGQYDRLYEVDLIKNLQAKIKKLARHVPPQGKLYLEPLSSFTNVFVGEKIAEDGNEDEE